MDIKIQEYGATEVKCEKCGMSIRVKDLIKLKDRYCCPKCFSTIKFKKKEGK